MKVFLSLMAIIYFTKECGNSQTSDHTKSAESAVTLQENVTFTYEVSTRGFYEKIWVDNEVVKVTNDRNLSDIATMPTAESDWNSLLGLLKQVNVSNLPNLKAPSSSRDTDGAAIATFSVIEGKNETTTEPFDNGNPPKAIEALINKVISMKKNFNRE